MTDRTSLDVSTPPTYAAGVKGVQVALDRAVRAMGPVRATRALRQLNQAEGFDCMSCAWADPDPGARELAEFCENGAKAVAEEATTHRATPEFFAAHSLAELDAHDEHWLGQQGRITHPMVKRPGDTHYRPIAWQDAFSLIAGQLRALGDPDRAMFYTSGRTSNEAAFAYQLFVRAFGTNNLPDCSNMCHESSGTALTQTIGIGKGSVSLLDVAQADLIVIAGQNPGTNHPRMLSTLEAAKRRGAKILAINPLREPGLVRFKNPQKPRGVLGSGTHLADQYLRIRLNGDLALFQAIGSLLVEWDALDHDFIARSTRGFEAWAEHVRRLDWGQVELATGLTREEITTAAQMFRDSEKTVICWAMGITQHKNAVATIQEFVNVALAQGNLGKPGAGLCPVRGHSNVQGDRTMGIWERVPDHFLDSLRDEFGFEPPREHGVDTVEGIRQLRDKKIDFFLGMGGNFVHASPDTAVTSEALRSAAMTVQVSTKLNRSHLHVGETALILPALGRTEVDLQASGPQVVTVEDSMSSVHASHGPLQPASRHLLSEVAIVTLLAEATLGDRHGIDWAAMRDDYTVIRRHISHVVPGCEAYDEKSRRPGGFVMPHPPRDSRSFDTESGKAEFTVTPIEVLSLAGDELLLQTMRSHDQFNTTIYGMSDRYRGIEGGRDVVFVNGEDLAALGFSDGDRVDIESVWDHDDVERVVRGFRVVEFDTPRGCAAAYYPETNPLVPLDSTADESNTPVSKSVRVRLLPPGTPATQRDAEPGDGMDSTGSDEGHKSRHDPTHLS